MKDINLVLLAFTILNCAVTYIALVASLKWKRAYNGVYQQYLYRGKRSREQLFMEYFGKKGTADRDVAERIMQEYPGRTPMGSVLFKIHTHAELCRLEEIVYREKDIVKLLGVLGYDVKFGDEK